MAVLHIYTLFLDLILVIHCLCNLNILIIKPTSNPELHGCFCKKKLYWPCKTLEEFTNNSVYVNNNDNFTMVFLPGEHNLTKELIIRGVKDLTMAGIGTNYNSCSPILNSQQQSVEKVRITLKANLTIEGSTNLTMSRLSIDGRNENIVTVLTAGIADFVVSIENATIVRSGLLLRAQTRLFSNYEGVITLSNMTFISSTVMFDFEKTNKITLRNVVFFLGPAGNAITFCSQISHVLVQNIEICTLNSPSDASTPSLHCSDLFQKYVKKTCDMVIYLSTGNDIKLNRFLTINISNSSLTRSFGAGICTLSHLPTQYWLWSLNMTLQNSIISNHTEGGLDIVTGYLKNLSLSLINTNFSSNINYRFSASGLNIQKNSEDANIFMEVINATFEDNEHLMISEQQTTIFLWGITKFNVSFENCQFINNYGTAIRAINIEEVKFVGRNTFRNNTGYRGGALYLDNSVIGLDKNSSLIFKDNIAKDVGGAIYVYPSINFLSSNLCFLRLISYCKSCKCWTNCSDNQTCYEINFVNNSAANGGEHIFGSVRKSCKDLSCTFLTSDYELYSRSALASTPTRVCLCQEGSDTVQQMCENTSLIFTSKSIYPGEEFHLKAVLVGDMFGTGTGSVYAQFMYPEQKKEYRTPRLKPSYQYSQRVNNYRICQQLNYTAYSSESKEILVLTANYAPVVSFTDKEFLINSGDTESSEDSRTDTLLSTPVYINLTLLPCPPGFYLNGKPPGCDCVPALSNHNLRCSLSQGTGYAYRSGTIWVKLNNESTTIQKSCPFEYCREDNSSISFNDSDSQCTVNRAGILCGACKPGFSLALGSNKCLSCSNNNNVALLIFFAAAGFLLVFFIKILNMTVSQGTINGLIFYANILWAYESIFFPSDDTSLGKAWLLKTFIAWLNLDLGIETCFVQGLTAYAKTWLQFVFPLYICIIVIVMIISAHYSGLMTRLLGNNSVQVLATLFLLIYAKLLRTIIIALVSASLYTYQTNGELMEEQSVWAFDGNLSYNGSAHIFLFIAALLTLLIFVLPYTAILLFFQYLRRGTSFKILRWVIKLIPFFETYFGPLKTKYFYWVGLLLLVRCFLFAVFILSYSSVPSAGLLAILVTITFLLTIFACTGHIYRNCLLSLFEYSFFVNLQILTAMLFFTELTKSSSKELILCISVGVAFVQFVGIVIYHTWLRISKVINKKFMLQLKTKNNRSGEDNEEYVYQLMPEDSDKATSEMDNNILKDIDKGSFLEDHAVNADIDTITTHK